MNRYWIAACDRVGELSLRERVIVFAAAVALLAAGTDNLLLSPLLEKQKALSARIVQQQERMKAQQAQMQALLQARSESEHSPLRRRLEELRQQLDAQSAAMKAAGEGMVAPSKMADMLEQVLKQDQSVRLVELKTLAPTPVVAERAAAGTPEAGKGEIRPATPVPQVFRHGVQVAVRGRYLDLMRYVAALEKLPVRMAWGEASLDVERYPDAVLRLTLYTYSMEKTWLSI